MPLSELEPLARIISSVEHQRLPVAVRGVSPSMLRLLGVERIDEGCRSARTIILRCSAERTKIFWARLKLLRW